ncbi:MAG: arylsulfatase [Rikenellaceae bacterium]
MNSKITITTVATIIPLSLLSKTDKPNVVYILADDLGYGDITALDNDSKIPTPNIDKLVEQGMKFTNAHSTSSVSTPSRYSILTGRYNWRSSLQSGLLWSYSAPLIEKERPTVATILSANGYNTGIVGKWHLGLGWERFGEGIDDVMFTKLTFSPIDNGFDESFITSASLDMPPYAYIRGYEFTAPVNDTVQGQSGYKFFRTGPIAEDFEVETVMQRFTTEVLDYINEKSKDDKPYFLYFPMTAPHVPNFPPEEYQGKSGLNLYADFVMYVDHVVGQIVEQIEKTGEKDNTIVIFASDNGCSRTADIDLLKSLGHSPNSIYRGIKSDMYDGGHRVPFIVKWPNVVKAGAESDKAITLASLMATCADINDIKLPENCAEDSFSILDELKGKKSKKDSRGESLAIHHSVYGHFAIRKGDWKLIVCPYSGGWGDPKKNTVTDETPRMQLFNMKDNASEESEQNLIDEEPEIADELYKELVWAIENGRTTEGLPQSNDVEKVIIDKFNL